MSSRLRRFRWCKMFLLLASLVGLGPTALAQPDEVVSWIEQNAIPFSTFEVGDDLIDLEPLRALIGDARIVGLGEQTHGTSEFVTMKQRIIRFLVQEMGFAVIALESSLGGGLIADRYTHGPRGTPTEAMRLLEQWFFNTGEFGRVLDWLRDYNEAAMAPVRVVGVDVFSPHKALEWFASILPTTDHPGSAATLRDIRYRLPSKSRLAYSSSMEDRWEYIAFVDAMVEEIVSVSAELEAILDPWETMAVRRIPRVVDQLRGAYGITSTERNAAGWWVPESWNYRDASMAENVAWWLEVLGPGAKMIVWAHNGHIAMQWPEAESVPMGETLAARFGEDYVSVGFSTCEGTFTSYNPELPGLGPLPVPAPEPDSYELAFCSAGIPNFFLDLRELPSGTEVSDWMNASRGFKTIGAAPDVVDGQVTSAYDIDATLPAMFDVIVHIESTHASY